MSIEAINEQLLRAIGVGVAILEPQGLTISFRNEAFGEWFEAAEIGVPLAEVFPDLDLAAVTAALDAEGRYSGEISFRRRRRTLVIALAVTRADAQVIVLECQNITRIRELESMIESYSSMVERNTRDLQREKERVEKLLLSIMPRTVYEEYKTFGVVTPQAYDPVSVLTLDFVDFDALAGRLSAAVMVSDMNDIFAAFDRIGEQFGCERIKTVGDSYVTVCGMPEPMEGHAAAIANAALRFVRYLDRRNESHPQAWQCRIGIASGAVIGSVVGVQKYVYDIFGPAVNLSGRLRDQAGPMEILCCDSLQPALAQQFATSNLGERDLWEFGAQPVCRIDKAI
ncbi:adenylate/guanylate cyclase domain-containing protein [Rhodobacteraceae bacterium NNCM2]|nr:adenylate/guanylate cyclase domain-containing protein [Coraliihabitans acroporae]